MKEEEEIRKEFELEAKEKWWTNPVCHGETGFASWKYQLWLENKIIELKKKINCEHT